MKMKLPARLGIETLTSDLTEDNTIQSEKSSFLSSSSSSYTSDIDAIDIDLKEQ
jgi:hypothetical protein